tara:strand:+ start:23 stop:589 length:567 start_codon:yes stop_codon:yes gene_type:complete
MPVTINGSGSITGLAQGGIDGTKVVTAAAQPAGAVLQVKQSIRNEVATKTGNSFEAIAGLSVSITPSSASNKILIHVELGTVETTGNQYGHFIRLYKNGSHLTGASAINVGSRFACFLGGRTTNNNHSQGYSGTYLDTAGGTSAITYAPYWRAEGGYGTLYLNSEQSNPDGGAYLHNISSITVTEIAV